MSILYINSDAVCLCNNNLSKIYYYGDKQNIQFEQFERCVKKICKREKLIVFISSFYTNINFIQNNSDKINFTDVLSAKLEHKDVICGNVVFLKKNKDAVVTTINSNAEENHIKKILKILDNYNIDLRYVYCMDQLTSLYGIQDSKDYSCCNVVVILAEKQFFLSVANGGDFMFGREIMFESQENIIAQVASVVSMAIKNIEATYVNIKSKIQIKVYSFKYDIDVDELRTKDVILKNMDIDYVRLQEVAIDKGELLGDSKYKLFLIKATLSRLKHLQPLTSIFIRQHTRLFRLIKLVKFCFLLFCCIVGGFVVYFLASVSVLESGRQSKKALVREERQKLINHQNESKKISKNMIDVVIMKFQQLKLNDEYNDPLSIIASVTSNYKSLFDVQSYQFECVNCNMDRKVFFVSFEIELYNRNKSYVFTQTNIRTLIKDISNQLKKKYKYVSVFDEKLLNVGIKDLAVEDFFDTIFVVCTNDGKYALPSNKDQFNNSLSNNR